MAPYSVATPEGAFQSFDICIRLDGGRALAKTTIEALAGLPRRTIEAVAECLIDRLDAIDGDPDIEDSEMCHWQVDRFGHWLGADPGPGNWHEDDEDSADREEIDEREPDDADAA